MLGFIGLKNNNNGVNNDGHDRPVTLVPSEYTESTDYKYRGKRKDLPLRLNRLRITIPVI